MRTERHLAIIHREMHHATAQLKQQLARVAVGLILRDGVRHRLLGQRVLQLEGRHRQAIDEQAQVQRTRRLVIAVAQLPRHAENVLGEAVRRAGIARRWQEFI